MSFLRNLKTLARSGWRRVSRVARPIPGIASLVSLPERQQVEIVSRSDLFDATSYVRRNGRLMTQPEAGVAAQHYVRSGEALGLTPHELFDPAWYSSHHRDPSALRVNQLVHFELIGRREGRAPSSSFDPNFYLREYADVARAGLDPLQHFLKMGRLEGRLAHPDQSPLKPGAWFAPREAYELFAVADPLDSDNRAAADAWRNLLSGASADQAAVMHVLHVGGGGTERRIRDIIAEDPDGRHLVLFTERNGSGGWSLRLLERSIGYWRSFQRAVRNEEELSSLLSALNLDRIHVHQAREIVNSLARIINRLPASLEITVNDFSLLCPRDSFVHVSGAYCGEPDEDGCNACLRQRPGTGAESIRSWRDAGRDLLQKATIVYCPTEDTARRIRNYAPNARTHVSPPPETIREFPVPAARQKSGLRIATIGALSIQKGGGFLLDCIAASRAGHERVEWLVIGYFGFGVAARAQKMRDSFDVTGAYRPEELGSILAGNGVDLIFFPQHCVETYSYALSEALASGLPLVAPDIGPFRERTAGIERCMLYSVLDTPEDVLARMIAWARRRHLSDA